MAQTRGSAGSLVVFEGAVAALRPSAAPLIPNQATVRPQMRGSTLPDFGVIARPLGSMARLGVQGKYPSGPHRCTPDRTQCIALATYIADVCAVMERAAQEARLDPHFFARLIWQESRFDATAVSHAGAQGIAQFMPGTARERGLADPFNPAEALYASAHLLADLRDEFGNLGLAAAAYNAGGGRVRRFLRGTRLPGETRNYVSTITGLPSTSWRTGRPTPDLRLDGATPFQAACRALAQGREIIAFRQADRPGVDPT